MVSLVRLLRREFSQLAWTGPALLLALVWTLGSAASGNLHEGLGHAWLLAPLLVLRNPLGEAPVRLGVGAACIAALDVLELLHRRGATLSYTDPYVPTFEQGDLKLTSVPEAEAGSAIDCAVICTNHTAFDYASLPARFPLVVDTRNALKERVGTNIVRL